MRWHVLRTKTTKKNKESTIEKVSTLNPALEIVLLLYISILCNKTHSLYLLGNAREYGYTLSTPSCLEGFLQCLRYRYTSQSGGVTDMPKLHVHVINWQGFQYNLDNCIFLLSPYVHIYVCQNWRPIFFGLSTLRSQGYPCSIVSIRDHL